MSCNPYFSLNLTSEDMEAKLLSFGQLVARENDSALLYDQQFLLDSIAALYTLVNTAQILGYDYPMLYDRVEVGPITPTEYADFLIATGTTPDMVIPINAGTTTGTGGTGIDGVTPTDYLSTPAIQYLDNMNTYYTDNFSSSITGGFCAAYSKFQSFLSQALAFISKAQNILSQLANIEALIKQLIDTIVDKVRSIINQLIAQVNSCLGSIQNVANKVQDIANFFSPAGIESIKDSVKIIIADIGSKFEIPATQTDPLAYAAQVLEAVNYLLYRLCQLTTAIEDFMMAPVKALQDAIANCSQVRSVLTNASNQFTLNSVLAGAFRMSDDQVKAVKGQLGDELNGTNTGSGVDNTGTATPSHYWTQEFNDDEKNMYMELMQADKTTLEAGSTRIQQQYLTFGSQVLNQDDEIPGAGILKLRASIIIIATRISTRLGGKKLLINSGYRSPAYNASVGGAKNSCHMSGLALDISMSSFGSDFASVESFIKIASQEGVGGIGVYNSFVHIDTGQRRTWNSNHANALSIHMSDGFRTNKTGVRSSAF